MSCLRCLAPVGLGVVLCLAACGAPSGTEGAGGSGGDAWEPVGTYHLTDPTLVNLRIAPDGTFRWGADFFAAGGGRWETVDGRLVLTPSEGEATFEWLVGYPNSAVWNHGNFERLDVVPGDRAGELIVSGALAEPFFHDKPEWRVDSITQRWMIGGRCPVPDTCGVSWEPCDAPPVLECSPYADMVWCPPREEPPDCSRDHHCDDGDLCTHDFCREDEGACDTRPVRCDDLNDCTADGACGPEAGCTTVSVSDGTPCAGGSCTSGACELEGLVLPCTEQGIRNAVAAGGGPYTFDCGGPATIMISAELRIENDVILDGEGNLTLDGRDDHRVIWIEEGATVALRGLTVTRGNAFDGSGPTPDRSGGGIVNFGTLMLEGCGILGNRAYGGGGIWNLGILTMASSTVSGNHASEGGGIINQGYGVLEMTDSVVSNNLARRDGGGGIVNLEGTLSIVRSAISKNTGGQWGGGILQVGSEPSTSIEDSTVSENFARSGGGIVSYGGRLAIIGSTVFGNSAERTGGGIVIQDRATFTNSTVSGNSALGDCHPNDGGGGGIIVGDGGDLRLTGVTIAQNLAMGSGSSVRIGFNGTVAFSNTIVQGDCYREGVHPEAAWVSMDYNVESPGNTCGFTEPNDRAGVVVEDLKLEPLRDNGGFTLTHALGEGSVALDSIPGAACLDANGVSLKNDQRGEPRDATCDVGAFEAQP